MTVKAIIEKGAETYGIRSDSVIGRCYLSGFGDSVEDARNDFMTSIEEAIQDAEEQGLKHPDPDSVKVAFSYDLPSFFNYFDMINTSKFAGYVGINESKMRQYKSGIAYPGEKTTKKILSAIKRIGTELTMVSL